MRRRQFVGRALATGALPAPAALAQGGLPAHSGDELAERVRGAMLTMQRASWEQGVAAQALLERGDEELAVLMAREAVLRQAPDGRLSVLYTDNGVTDPAASGEAVLHAARVSGDARLKEAADRMLSYLLDRAPRAADGTLYHTVKEPEIWVDSMYMAPPFLAVAGRAAEAVRQLDGMRRRLWNPAKRLYSHRWDEGKGTFVNASAWGVGNGWAMAGLARVAADLPGELAPERDRLRGIARETIDGCLAHLRPDGLFHNVVDDPGTFVETNLSQMAAYTIFRGVGEGWLERPYLEPALRMRTAARAKVDDNGYVQGVCGAPFFDKPGRAAEGQAFFLLMEAARSRL
jgi:unsaturated rhamnogalacturonyl hydrolase